MTFQSGSRCFARASVFTTLLSLIWPFHGALAQGLVRGNYSDWELRCEQQPQKDEQCILYQNVADEKDSNINVVVVILRVAEGAGADGKPASKKPVLRVIAPLGVLLPRGLGLRIESATEKDAQGKPTVKDIGSTGFVKCVPSGCVAEVEIDDKLHNELKNGQTATFIIRSEERRVGKEC